MPETHDLTTTDELTAMRSAFATIEFAPDGTILDANERFLAVMGYARDEIVGRHHRMFMPPAQAEEPSYAALWAKLRAGTAHTEQVHRLAKGGADRWLNGAYVPLKNADSAVVKVIKLATDVTDAHVAAMHDATQLRQTLTRTARELDALRDAFATIEFTPDGIITYANDAFLAVMGYTRDEVIGRHHRMFVPEDYAVSEDYADFWARLRTGRSYSAEIYRLAKGGDERWLNGSYVPMPDDTGRVTRVIKFANDVTHSHLDAERNAADLQDTLTRTARELDALRNAFATIEFTPDGTITYANDAFLAVMGYARDEVIGKHHRMFAPPGYAETKDYADFWARLRTGKPYAAEIHRKAKGGTDRWLNGSYVPMPDAQGRIVKVIKFANDVTDTHVAADRSRAEVERSVTRSDIINEAAGIGQWELTLAGQALVHADNEYWFSPKFKQLLGYEGGRGFPTHASAVNDIIHPDDHEVRARALRAHIANPKSPSFEFEYRLRGPDGTWRWFHNTGTVQRRADGSPFRITGAIRDITADKEALLAVDHTIERAVTGDLTVRLDTQRLRGATQRMGDNLNRLLDTLSDAIRLVKSATEQVSQAAVELGSTSQLMSEGAVRLSQGVDESASQLQKVATGVRANAQSAAMANQLVSQTATAARSGDARMTEMNAAMGAIHTSAQQIAKIIKVIDEIAFQTNLLALNAAVEAARAGRHGRGFAVVAQEVRSLAERSARAAKETTALIADSVGKVGEGVRIAEATRTALGEITRNVEKVVDLVGEVSVASEEQSQALSTVTHAMHDISEGTQGASQQSTEVASAAEQLSRQMRVLKDQMDRYSVPELHAATSASIASDITPETLERIATLLRSGGLAHLLGQGNHNASAPIARAG